MEVLLVLLGIVIGSSSVLIWCKRTTIGTIRIDQSDPTEPPYLFLELKKPVETFVHKKYVLCRVSNKNYIPENE